METHFPCDSRLCLKGILCVCVCDLCMHTYVYIANMQKIINQLWKSFLRTKMLQQIWKWYAYHNCKLRLDAFWMEAAKPHQVKEITVSVCLVSSQQWAWHRWISLLTPTLTQCPIWLSSAPVGRQDMERERRVMGSHAIDEREEAETSLACREFKMASC